MSNSIYPLRTFEVPPGFKILPLSTDVYTDTIINNLYTQFACCYGQRISKYVQAQKKGIQCKIDCKTKYLLMALYVLRNWYNQNYSFSIPLHFIAGTYNVSTLFVQAEGISDATYPLFENAIGVTPSLVLAAIQALLPAGYTASLNNTQTRVIIKTSIAPPVANLTWMWSSQPSFTAPGYYSWAPLGTMNSCISYSAIQNIIQNCIKICGCTNCLNLPALEADNVYTPIGIKSPAAIAGPTLYTNLPYFN